MRVSFKNPYAKSVFQEKMSSNKSRAIFGAISCFLFIFIGSCEKNNKPVVNKSSIVADKLPALLSLYQAVEKGDVALGFHAKTTFTVTPSPTSLYDANVIKTTEESLVYSNGQHLKAIETKQDSGVKVKVIIDHHAAYVKEQEAPYVKNPLSFVRESAYFDSTKLTYALLQLIKSAALQQKDNQNKNMLTYQLTLPTEKKDRFFMPVGQNSVFELTNLIGSITITADQSMLSATQFSFSMKGTRNDSPVTVEIEHTFERVEKPPLIAVPKDFVDMPVLKSPVKDAKKLGLPIK